jgi:hypothetical protein
LICKKKEYTSLHFYPAVFSYARDWNVPFPTETDRASLFSSSSSPLCRPWKSLPLDVAASSPALHNCIQIDHYYNCTDKYQQKHNLLWLLGEKLQYTRWSPSICCFPPMIADWERWWLGAAAPWGAGL